jgi:hypothetical protein
MRCERSLRPSRHVDRTESPSSDPSTPDSALIVAAIAVCSSQNVTNQQFAALGDGPRD